jgi:hypothetical protein
LPGQRALCLFCTLFGNYKCFIGKLPKSYQFPIKKNSTRYRLISPGPRQTCKKPWTSGTSLFRKKRRESTIEEEGLRIANLELVIETQLDDQDVLELKLKRSEDELKQLLEIPQLEDRKSDGVGTGRGVASLIELHRTKKALAEKEAELISRNERIEHLELELRNSLSAPQLQIEELDTEMEALKGKLKGGYLNTDKN